MKISLNFSHDDGEPNDGDRVDFEAPPSWNAAFPPPVLKARIAGKERLFYRVEFSNYYHEVVPVDVEEFLPEPDVDAIIAEGERAVDQILDERERTGL